METSNDSNYRKLEFPIDGTSPFKGPRGRNYLLTIGIDKYKHFPVLQNAVSDAKNVIDVLTNRYQFQPEYVISLFDEDATEKNINGVFRELIQEVTPEDNLTIYFSGHGHYDELEDLGYWIPVDAEDFHEYLSNDRIVRFLKRIDSFHTFLVVDSCFSGSLFTGTRSGVSEKMDKIPSRWGLTSGMNEPVLDGPIGESSPFARYFLEHLNNNQDEHLLVSDLIQYVKKAVGANVAQQPLGNRLHGVGDRGMGEFVFYLRKNESRDWTEAQQKDTLDIYQSFIQKYPASTYLLQAKNRIKDLEEEQAWQKSVGRKSLAGYFDYLDKYPTGKYRNEAKKEIDQRQKEAENRHQEVLESQEKKENEDKAWIAATQENTNASYEAFLDQYPMGRYAGMARNRKSLLQKEKDDERLRIIEAEAWQFAKNADKIAVYKDYLEQFPKGIHVQEASNRKRELEAEWERENAREKEEQAWQFAKNQHSVAEYEAYLNAYPNGEFTDEAKNSIENLKKGKEDERRAKEEAHNWKKVLGMNTERGYDAFLNRYPNSEHIEEAKKRKAALTTGNKKTGRTPKPKQPKAQQQRKSSPIKWAVLGALGGIIAIIAVAVIFEEEFAEVDYSRDTKGVYNSYDDKDTYEEQVYEENAPEEQKSEQTKVDASSLSQMQNTFSDNPNSFFNSQMNDLGLSNRVQQLYNQYTQYGDQNALYQIEQLANNGAADAQLVMGAVQLVNAMLYNNTNYYTYAFNYFEASANQGNTNAQYCLGYMYNMGLGVYADYTQAYYWFSTCARAGNLSCQQTLRQFGLSW